MSKKTFFALLPILIWAFVSCKKTNDNPEQLLRLSKQLDSSRVLLPNGWSLSLPGPTLPLGDFPMNMVLSPQGNFMAITNNGQSQQSITLLDVHAKKILGVTPIPRSWYGLAFSADDQYLYASGGNDNRIMVYALQGNTLVKSDSIALGKPWPSQRISPTGIALDDKAKTLYVATKDDSSLYIVDLPTKTSKRLFLGHEAYACILGKDNKQLYISLWGGDKIAVYDLGKGQITATIPVGSNPNEMVITRDGRYLYVANANDNTVSVIETSILKVNEVFSAALYGTSLAGSTPNALALNKDETRLYIANADNNCLAVFDVSEPGKGKGMGFIPTGWYPTSVKVVDGDIWTTHGKGLSSLPNPEGPHPYKGRSAQFIGGLFKGTLGIVPEPSEKTLGVYTEATYKNSPYAHDKELVSNGEEGNPIPKKVGDKSPIKYVFYIIKENRTYDQVLGDLPQGNGDTSLCLFHERITPNQHALARQFVLLDNFYVNAEVSADGHNWSMAAYANDYVEKNWPTGYGNRGGSYDYEGTRDIAWPKDGFIWDYCQRNGVSYRSYGEFIHDGGTKLTALQGHFDPDYPEYDLNVPDQLRFEKWKTDFDSLVSINALPQLSTIRLPNDHTAGTRAGMPTPRAMVAENDMALGKMIEHISKSKVWMESAIFVLEDDAQNGPDHVDAHRSIAFVASPYTKRKAVVRSMYSTTSMLRTIELILGLPPMSQYDAGAVPMWECFTAVPDLTPYTYHPPQYNLREMNVPKSPLSRRSEHFNLKVMDAVPDLAFSEVIWKSVKGENSPMPPPVRSAFIAPHEENEGEEEE